MLADPIVDMECPPVNSRPPWYHRMDDQGETPLSRAFKSSYPILVELLLEQEHAHAVSKAEEQVSEESSSSYWGQGNAIRSMLSAKRSKQQGNTPLMRAVCDGQRDAVEDLLHEGIDVNAANDKGLTSMHWASLTGRVDIAELLLNSGAEANPISPSGYWPSPAGIALLMGYHELYDLLCTRGGHR